MENTMKVFTCKVCGARFYPSKEGHYVAQEPGLFAPIFYDVYDCPQCGSQFVAGRRMLEVAEEEE